METNVIYNEDCYIGIKNIPNNSVDLVIIDPPYDIDTRRNRIGYNRIAKSILKVENTLLDHNLTESYDFSLLDESILITSSLILFTILIALAGLVQTCSSYSSSSSS